MLDPGIPADAIRTDVMYGDVEQLGVVDNEMLLDLSRSDSRQSTSSSSPVEKHQDDNANTYIGDIPQTLTTELQNIDACLRDASGIMRKLMMRWYSLFSGDGKSQVSKHRIMEPFHRLSNVPNQLGGSTSLLMGLTPSFQRKLCYNQRKYFHRCSSLYFSMCLPPSTSTLVSSTIRDHYGPLSLRLGSTDEVQELVNERVSGNSHHWVNFLPHLNAYSHAEREGIYYGMILALWETFLGPMNTMEFGSYRSYLSRVINPHDAWTSLSVQAVTAPNADLQSKFGINRAGLCDNPNAIKAAWSSRRNFPVLTLPQSCLVQQTKVPLDSSRVELIVLFGGKDQLGLDMTGLAWRILRLMSETSPYEFDYMKRPSTVPPLDEVWTSRELASFLSSAFNDTSAQAGVQFPAWMTPELMGENGRGCWSFQRDKNTSDACNRLLRDPWDGRPSDVDHSFELTCRMLKGVGSESEMCDCHVCKLDPDTLKRLFKLSGVMNFPVSDGCTKHVAFLFVDYPGHGNSEGRLTPESMIQSSVALLSRSVLSVAEDVATKTGKSCSSVDIKFLGYSLGCSVAIGVLASLADSMERSCSPPEEIVSGFSRRRWMCGAPTGTERTREAFPFTFGPGDVETRIEPRNAIGAEFAPGRSIFRSLILVAPFMTTADVAGDLITNKGVGSFAAKAVMGALMSSDVTWDNRVILQNFFLSKHRADCFLEPLGRQNPFDMLRMSIIAGTDDQLVRIPRSFMLALGAERLRTVPHWLSQNMGMSVRFYAVEGANHQNILQAEGDLLLPREVMMPARVAPLSRTFWQQYILPLYYYKHIDSKLER